MTAPPLALTIDAGAVRRYEGWRRQWRSGGHTQAISLLFHHGLAHALTLSASSNPAPAAPLSEARSSEVPLLSDCAAVTQAAARMIHELLVR